MGLSALLHWAVDRCYVSFLKDPRFPLLHYLILSPPLWTDKGPWIHDERRCNWAQWSYHRKIGVQTLALSPLHYQPLEFCSRDNYIAIMWQGDAVKITEHCFFWRHSSEPGREKHFCTCIPLWGWKVRTAIIPKCQSSQQPNKWGDRKYVPSTGGRL